MSAGFKCKYSLKIDRSFSFGLALVWGPSKQRFPVNLGLVVLQLDGQWNRMLQEFLTAQAFSQERQPEEMKCGAMAWGA